MSLKQTNSTKGFTLIELMIAITILGFAAISLLPMFYYGFAGIITAGNQSKAIYQAEYQLTEKIAHPEGIKTSLSFTFGDSGEEKTISITGHKEEIEVNYQDIRRNPKTITLTYFNPEE